MVKIIGEALPNIPFEPRPAGMDAPVWRHSGNPLTKRNPVKGVARIFNSCVVPWEGAFVGVFRGEKLNGVPELYFGRSADGVSWDFDDTPIDLRDEHGVPANPAYSYDPRVIRVEGVYYGVWCTDGGGATLGMARTTDFKTFTRMENPTLPFNRNGVLFPRRVNGMYKLLSRPSDSGHTPFGDIYISESPDLIYWGKHRHLMGKGAPWWQNLKIGAGPAPIETTEGWLMLFHGVTNTCNGFVYSMGGAILDIVDPTKVLYRSENFLLTPEEEYEERGFVPNVVFPCAALTDADTGRIAIYYGAADTYVGLALAEVDELVRVIKETTRL